jgi:ABC-type dipeptide/oligopeptide/nickel transport system permease subunit
VGVSPGVLGGYRGGHLDALLMGIADVQYSFLYILPRHHHRILGAGS